MFPKPHRNMHHADANHLSASGTSVIRSLVTLLTLPLPEASLWSPGTDSSPLQNTSWILVPRIGSVLPSSVDSRQTHAVKLTLFLRLTFSRFKQQKFDSS